MSQQQREALEQLLRDAPLDLGGEVAEQRGHLEEMMAAVPLPADVATSSGSLGGIPVVNVETAGADHQMRVRRNRWLRACRSASTARRLTIALLA
jgi:hypothetical protein